MSLILVLTDLPPPLQTHVPHQARHCTTGDVQAFAFELSLGLAHAVDGEMRIDHPPNLELQGSVLRWRAPTAWSDRAALVP
ncbi:hypothetical protein GGD61_008053 [Bradyrhizobium sp. SBR1B]|nr:hypothetical protein [Bradyrhizobium sp. SBR1B]